MEHKQTETGSRLSWLMGLGFVCGALLATESVAGGVDLVLEVGETLVVEEDRKVRD